MSALERLSLGGIAASPGIAVGPAVVFDRRRIPVPRRRVEQAAVEAEVARLADAMAAARAEVEAIRDALPGDAGVDQRLLLETQLLMLQDALLSEGAAEAIRERAVNAEWALRDTVEAIRQRLRATAEPYIRERADDVGHVGDHVLQVLTGVSRSLPPITAPAVLVASDLSPAEAAQLPPELVLGLVTDAGSASSHTAILARALRVPAIVGVREVTQKVSPGERVVVDALRAEVIIRPEPEEIEDAERRAARFRSFEDDLRQSVGGAASTADGVPVGLYANIEIEADVERAKTEGADGIGLYRTEYLYLDRREPPTEEEQTALYRRVARRMAPRVVTFRTFDLGGDKIPHGMRTGPNPALGMRALRVAFERPELLVTQLRALLRAASEGNVAVMFPMVTGVGDLRAARVLLERAREDLEGEGAAYGPVMVGSMLEVPSAVVVADRLAPSCDFFSVGTNDLTQYALAVDRGDPRVAHLARALDPAVLRLLDRARDVAADARIPISVCGDVAADPVATPILVGLGLTQLSMPHAAIPLIREALSRIDAEEAARVARAALDQDDANGVERLVAAAFGDALGELWEHQGIELPRF